MLCVSTQKTIFPISYKGYILFRLPPSILTTDTQYYKIHHRPYKKYIYIMTTLLFLVAVVVLTNVVGNVQAFSLVRMMMMKSHRTTTTTTLYSSMSNNNNNNHHSSSHSFPSDNNNINNNEEKHPIRNHEESSATSNMEEHHHPNQPQPQPQQPSFHSQEEYRAMEFHNLDAQNNNQTTTTSSSVVRQERLQREYQTQQQFVPYSNALWELREKMSFTTRRNSKVYRTNTNFGTTMSTSTTIHTRSTMDIATEITVIATTRSRICLSYLHTTTS